MISVFPELRLGLEYLFQISILNCLLLHTDLHFPEFPQFLLKFLPERILFCVLLFELPESLVGLAECLRNVPVLLLPHANGLILLGEGDLVGVVALLQQVVDLVLVDLVVLACLRNVLLQSVAHFPVQTLDVEVHVVRVEVLQHFSFGLDVRINPKEGRDLVLFDVHQVFIGQVLQQNMASLGSVLGQAIQNALLLLNRLLCLALPVVRHVSLLLVLDELVEPILFVVLVVVSVGWP